MRPKDAQKKLLKLVKFKLKKNSLKYEKSVKTNVWSLDDFDQKNTFFSENACSHHKGYILVRIRFEKQVCEQKKVKNKRSKKWQNYFFQKNMWLRHMRWKISSYNQNMRKEEFFKLVKSKFEKSVSEMWKTWEASLYLN